MNALFDAQLSLLNAGLTCLPDKPEENPARTLRALWLLAAGTHAGLVAAERATLPVLDEAGAERLTRLVRRRLEGVPLAHLTGRQDFMGIEMLVSSAALIPRKETEILASALGEAAREVSPDRGRSLRFLDVCTGVGNLAVWFAREFPGSAVSASDLSAEAVDAAKANALFCGVSAIDFRVGDLFAPFESAEFLGGLDVISCNPPYISRGRLAALPAEIGGYEPRAAFDGGAFGISIISRVVSEAPRFLVGGGWVVFEVGAGQGAPMLARVKNLPGYSAVRTYADAGGQIRALGLRKSAAAAPASTES